MIASRDELVERARRQTGLSDLGADGWQVGIDRLLAVAQEEFGDNSDAATALEALVASRLANRLRIEAWYADHAGRALPPVEGPVAVLGLPRTGTTALHYLLGIDPQFRYQRTWEVLDPVPPPDATTEASDPRRLAMPERNDVRHISSRDGPVEDVMVYGLDFHNQELGLPLLPYTRWWRTADLSSTLAYHERVLRMLHSRRPPHRWLLKAPMFIFHAAQLRARYPGVRFLMTHRDPVVSMPSTCSTVKSAMEMVIPAHPVDPVRLGRELLEHFGEGMRRLLADRPALGDECFCDVGQHELETDPLGTAERVYDFLGLRLTDQVRSAMEKFALENRRGARGSHHYTADEFGLREGEIRAAFRDYDERFGSLHAGP